MVRFTSCPSVLPDLLTGLRLALGFAWTTIVAAETTNGIPGIGGLAWATKKELRSRRRGPVRDRHRHHRVALDSPLQLVERRLVPWKGRA